MALTGITLVDTDLSTVLFDLHSADGSANASWGSVITRFAIGGHMKTTAPLDVERFEKPGVDGAFTTFSRRGLGTVEWRQGVSGSSEANLRLGLDRLTDLIARGVILRMVSGAATRYLRMEPSAHPVPYQGNEIEIWELFERLNIAHGLTVAAACQPYWEGPEVTGSSVTVPTDPATSTKVRVYPITVSGSLPTPAKVRVQMDSGSAVSRVLIAHRARNTRPASTFADYLSDTGFLQAESTGRGWTITLGTNTTSTADANASGGNMARISHSTDPLVYKRRIRATRTTKIDSLRGAWDVWVRVKAGAARDYRMQMRWNPSTADPAQISGPEITHNTAVNGTPPAFGYVELNLGRIYVPEEITLGGFALELWTRQASGSAADLDVDLFWLSPADGQGTVVVFGGSTETVLGMDLLTPVTNPAGGTAAAIVGTSMVPDTISDNMGIAPAGGIVRAAGRWRSTFVMRNTSGSSITIDTGVRNITSSNYVSGLTTRSLPGNTVRTFIHEWDANGTSAYQEQVDNPSAVPAKVYIESITMEFLAALASGESARTDPGRSSVDRLDASANLAGYLGTEGEVPLVLEPGDNHIMVRCGEVPLSLYEENESKLTRVPTVTVSYYPRYSL